MKTRYIAQTLLILGLALAANADPATHDDPPPQLEATTYRVTVFVYRILEDAWQEGITADGSPMDLQAQPGGQGGRALSGPARNKARIGGHLLDLRSNEPRWNGEPKPDDPNIMLLANPTLNVLTGQPASIFIGQDPPESFVPAGPEHPGLYRLVKAEKPLGIELTCIVSPAPAPDTALVDLQFTSTTLKKRLKLEGANLDVGQPVIATQSTDCRALLQSDQWLLTANPVPDGGGLLLLTKVGSTSPADQPEPALPESPEQITSIPPEAGFLIRAEARLLEIPAPHIPALKAALIPDETAHPIHGDAMVFRGLRPAIIGAHRPQETQANTEAHPLTEEAFAPFDADVLTVPTVTTLSTKLALWYRQNQENSLPPAPPQEAEQSPDNPSNPSEEQPPPFTFDEILQPLAETNPMLRTMIDNKAPGLAMVCDLSTGYPETDGTTGWYGSFFAFRADASELHGLIEADIAYDRRFDAALPRKRLLGLLPLKHRPDIRHLQCGLHLSLPDKAWTGLLLSSEEDQAAFVLLIKMEALPPSAPDLFGDEANS